LHRCVYFAHLFQIDSQSTPPIFKYSISYFFEKI
jgi:hypothetical protein